MVILLQPYCYTHVDHYLLYCTFAEPLIEVIFFVVEESQRQASSLRHRWPQHMPVVPQEAMAMAAAGAHPNVVRYYSAWTERQAEGQYFYILMEKCEVSLGTKHLLDGQPFREDELLDILRQVWTSAECGHGMRRRHIRKHSVSGNLRNLLRRQPPSKMVV